MKTKRLMVVSCILTLSILSIFFFSSQGIQALDLEGSAVAAPTGTIFTVNNTVDAVDSDPGNGTCSVVSSICSLRAAIQEANAYPGGDTIILPAGIYTLTIGGRGEDNAATGDLDITSNLTITGVSSQTAIIDANFIDRIFEITEGVTVTISNVTLRHGEPGLTYVGQTNNGGAIRNMGMLSVDSSTFDHNHANNGGGIMNGFDNSLAGNLIVTNSIFSNNQTYGAGSGGGIRNENFMIVSHSIFTGNVGTDFPLNPSGAGILNDYLGIATIENSIITGNSSPYGAGIGNGGVMIISNTSISGNHATQSDGGGISNRSHNAGSSGTLSIFNSTLSANSASNGNGGGIINQDGSVLIMINSTLSGNSAGGNGGGILNDSGTFDLNNVTIVSNTAAGSGGGIYRSGGIVYSRNTLLAQNSGTGGSPDCFGSILSGGYNLVGNNSGCTFGSTTGDQVGTSISPIDPLIDTLQDNGGTTWTHALFVGSPAIDLANPITPGSNTDACATVDQRGISRPQGSACDVGAYEAPAVPICTAPSTESDIILIIDRSGSMATDNKLADAQTAVTIFLSSTNAPPDQVGLVSFASDATLDQPLTTTKQAVIAATQLLTASGNTRIDLALMTARIELTGTNHILTHSKVIILLTDGVQNPAGNDPVITETNIAKAEGAVIFTIGLGPNVDTALLQQIATDANHYYYAPTGAQLAEIYQQISSAIGCPDIGGYVYVDQDNDGLYSPGTDTPMSNTVVKLIGLSLRQTASHANGSYVFADNSAGAYTMSLNLASVPIGYTPAGTTVLTINLTSTDSLENNFGLLPPGPAKIVFTRPQPAQDNSADSNIWIMNTDGSNQTQLTTFPGEDRMPAISPDGKKIVYTSFRSGAETLWVMDSDGNNALQLPVPARSGIPIWSPDGQHIAFQNNAGNDIEVWIIDADGTNLRRLTNHTEAAGSPSWAPNGAKLVYLTEPNLNYHDLYTINSNGTADALLISASSTGYSNHRPAWSPDGTQIATLHYLAGSSGPFDLWLMDADGSKGHMLVSNLDSHSLNRISWTSDNNWLVFARAGQVWKVQRNGSQLTQLTLAGGWEPSISGGPVEMDTVVQHVYLPLIQKAPPPPKGIIYGTVTDHGAAAVVALELRFYNGSTWSTRASTTTAANGSYSFLGVPGLSPGQIYYVRYLNTTTPSRLFTWHTRLLGTYAAGAEVHIGDFDVANIALVAPAPGATVSLPRAFQWSARPATTSDSYEFDLFDPQDGNPYFFTDPPLGYVSSYTLNGLPAGFKVNTQYVWDMWVYSPDGGYGISYYAYYVRFSTAGFEVASTERSRESVRPDDLIYPTIHRNEASPDTDR